MNNQTNLEEIGLSDVPTELVLVALAHHNLVVCCHMLGLTADDMTAYCNTGKRPERDGVSDEALTVRLGCLTTLAIIDRLSASVFQSYEDFMRVRDAVRKAFGEGLGEPK